MNDRISSCFTDNQIRPLYDDNLDIVREKKAGFLLTPEEVKVPQVVIEAEKNLIGHETIQFSFKKKETIFEKEMVME